MGFEWKTVPTVIPKLVSILLPLLSSVTFQDTNTDPEPQLTCNFWYYYLVRRSAECEGVTWGNKYK